MKFYAALFPVLTVAFCLNAADAVTSATPQPKQQAVKKAQPAAKKSKNVQKKKAAKNKNRTPNKKVKIPASVNISSFAPDAKDATAALQKAINTRAKEVVFDKAGTYFLRPVKLRGRMQFILKEGVKIQGILPKKNDAALPGLFTINNVSKVVIKGSGNNTISAPPGMAVFSIKNANNIELHNFTVENSSNGIKLDNVYGAKIYNIVFESLSGTAFELHGGNWNSMFDCQFRNLAGAGAVIFARKDGQLSNTVFDNCEFFNSQTGLVLRRPEQTVAAKAPDKKARPARFDIRSCRFFNNSGIDMELCGNLTFGSIKIENALFNNTSNTALKLVDFTNAADAVTLQINNSSFNPGETNLKTPIVCMGSLDLPVGNVKFSNTAVASPVHKKAICFDLKKKSGKLEGVLPVIAADGSRMNAILTVEEK